MHIQNPEKGYYSSSHLVYSCQYHVIFCPKYRRSVLNAPIDDELKELFQQIAEEHDFKIPDMEIMPDHVHLIVDCNPRFGIMNCVNKLKGKSAHVILQRHPELKKKLPSLWTRSAFISSVGSVSLATVKQYIADQKGK